MLRRPEDETDEADHCYLPEAGRRLSEDEDTKAAEVWGGALERAAQHRTAGPVYRFSATSIFIEGADRKERVWLALQSRPRAIDWPHQ